MLNVKHAFWESSYLRNKAVMPNTKGNEGAATAKKAIPNP